MANFLKSLFGGDSESPEEQAKKQEKKFELFKYDGLRAQKMGKTAYAQSCFEEALKIKEDYETFSYLAALLIQQNKWDEARNNLEQMIRVDALCPTAYLTMGHVCFLQEDYERMKEVCIKATELTPEEAMPFFLLAKADRGLKDVISAIANLTKALTLKEDFTEARLNRAEILLDMHQLKEAKEDIDRVLTADQEEETALLLLGRWQEDSDQCEEALQTYLQITEGNPFNEQAFLRRGKLLISLKRLEEAIVCLDEAIELNPSLAAAYKERGNAKLLNGDKEGSISDLKKALELNPKEGEALTGKFDNRGEELKGFNTGFDNTIGVFN